MEKKNMTAVIDRCLNGERLAQEELVLAVQNRVYYHCRKMLKDEDRALDLTQDVLLVMLTKLDTLQNPESFWTWLGGITANLCRNAINRGPREVQIPEDEEGNSLLDTYETMDEQAIPDKALDNDETRRMIAELVDDLPDAQRQCVLLYYYDEMSVKDIAASLNVSENTVKSRLNYARKSIKEGVERYEKQGVKLYGFSPLPFLLFFLRKDAFACSMSGTRAAEMARRVVETSVGSSVAGVAASTTASTTAGVAGGNVAGAATAAKTAAGTGVMSLSTKLIAALAAGALLIGGAAGGVLLGGKDNKDNEGNKDEGVVKGNPMEYVALPEWVEDPFDSVEEFIYPETLFDMTEEKATPPGDPTRTCWYCTYESEESWWIYFSATASMESPQITSARVYNCEAIEEIDPSVGWRGISIGDSFHDVMDKLGIGEVPPENGPDIHVIAYCYTDAPEKSVYDYIYENPEIFNDDPSVTQSITLYYVEEGASKHNGSAVQLQFHNGGLTGLQYERQVPALPEDSHQQENGEEPAGEVSDETLTEDAAEFGADGISVKFNGALKELSTPFRVYSMIFTQTQDNYYAIEQDAPFTVTNNGTDESMYIETYMLEYIRSKESFISQVVHNGEFVELDMLGEYWGNEDEALYLSDQMTTELSAGEGLYWAKSAQGGEDVPILKLRPGETVTFRLPQREQDAIYALFVRYRNDAGDLDLPVQRFWITADDVSSPANDAK